MASNKKNDVDKDRESAIQDIKKLDDAVHQLLKSNIDPLAGGTQSSDIDSIYKDFNTLIKADSYNFMKTKSNNQSAFRYVSNALLGRKIPSDRPATKQEELESKFNLERIFQNGDAQAASIFLNQSSDIQHICDEIESITAYLYQLDEAVLMFRDNIMNTEQSMSELPFDITFDDLEDHQDYVKIAIDTIKETGLLQQLNDHVVPKAIKFGRYFQLDIPYSEIGVKMLNDDNKTRNVFNYVGIGGGTGGPLPNGITESSNTIDENYATCMENVNIMLDNVFGEDETLNISGIPSKSKLRSIIENNINGLLVNDASTPLNVTGISESAYNKMDDELKSIVDKSIKENIKKFNANNFKNKELKNEDKNLADATIDPETLDSIPGCYSKLVDPRQMVPIKIFDHTLGYYYFENYDYSRLGTSLTDIMSNNINFNDQNMVIDNIVGSVLRGLKYGELLDGNNDFKSMVMNCVLYAERRQNPIRLKFIPAEYVTEFKVNCDEEGNGRPVLLKSIPFGRLYVSILLFIVTTMITKSTDTEFYYLKEGLLSQSYEDQVADIIEQFRNSNVDISQILNGNLMHGNRAINKRYFMCTGTQDQKPFDMEVISGQQVDTHNEFLEDLRKMAIGTTGIPALALDYMSEIEFATIAKMSNQKTETRSNNIQIDLNPSITEVVKRRIKYCKPNSIPDEVLDTLSCTLRPTHTINNNISADEINNNIATVDNMIETRFGGQNTETPPTIEYIKEELRRELIMKMSPSLPWGFMEEKYDEMIISGKIKEFEAKLRAKQAEDADNTEA